MEYSDLSKHAYKQIVEDSMVCYREMLHGGYQYKVFYPNGYGASIVKHMFSYGREKDLWELAVMRRDGRITYSTPITKDVVGSLSDKDVVDYCRKIKKLQGKDK